MKPEQLSLRTGAERAAMLTGWAGAVALISATGADGALVVNNTATVGLTIIQTPGVGASSAVSVGIQLDGNGAGGLFGFGGADIAITAGAGNAFGVGADYYGALVFELAVDGNTTFSTTFATGIIGTQGLVQKFASPDSVASQAASWLSSTSWGVLFQTSTVAAGYWAGQSGYIGFRIGETAGGPWIYGWMAISVDNSLGLSISHWSPDAIPGTNGDPALSAAGSGTPEPTAAGLGLLALGAAGVLRHKRRRKDEVA